MKVEIDQSGKIEQTNKNTIIALSNDKNDSIIINAKTKRQLQEVFRRHGQIRNYIIFTFSACLTILIERNSKYGKIYIDKEYYGRENLIEILIKSMFSGRNRTPDLEFCLIGKSANAHGVAYHVAVGEKMPNKIISFEEIIRIIKKTEVGKRLKNA